MELQCSMCKSKNHIKVGFTKQNKQRYRCKGCGKKLIDEYTCQAYSPSINQQIIALTKEGLGIRSTAHVLHISTTTLLKKLVSIAQNIPQPIIGKEKTYEVDEIRTFVKRKSKLIWIVYALERANRSIEGQTMSINHKFKVDGLAEPPGYREIPFKKHLWAKKTDCMPWT